MLARRFCSSGISFMLPQRTLEPLEGPAGAGTWRIKGVEIFPDASMGILYGQVALAGVELRGCDFVVEMVGKKCLLEMLEEGPRHI